MGPIAMASMSRNISHNDQVVIAAETAKALGVPLENTNISCTSSKYNSNIVRESQAKKFRKEFNVPPCVSLHYDGKLLGTKGKREN